MGKSGGTGKKSVYLIGILDCGGEKRYNDREYTFYNGENLYPPVKYRRFLRR